MAHGVLIPNAIAATNIDTLNRPVYTSASSIDNGMVFALSGKLETSGSSTEVWKMAAPANGNLESLWMAFSGDEIILTDSKYKGIDPDPRNFYIPAGKVFSAYRPQKGDIITLTAHGLTGTVESAYAVGTAGAYQLTWGATSGSSALTYKYLRTTYISLATGAIDDQRETAYEFECVVA